jgi:CheY-like chemotaxis protein
MRPTFLMAEPEALENISVRKLVLETAKFNVITAHSAKECLELLKKFPQIEAVIIHSDLNGTPCDKVVSQIKEDIPKTAVIALGTTDGFRCKGADHTITSHEPEALLSLLRSKFGDPRAQERRK